jgi:hypothetical protein
MNQELERRASNTQRLLAFFLERPLVEISWRELADVCESPASWRTRVADVRRIVKRDGGDIVWNRNVRESRYLYRPYVPLGRSAEVHVSQQSLF